MNTRMDNNGKAISAWKASGPGHIARPLKFIIDNLLVADKRAAGRVYRLAREGKGLSLARIALDMNRSNTSTHPALRQK